MDYMSNALYLNELHAFAKCMYKESYRTYRYDRLRLHDGIANISIKQCFGTWYWMTAIFMYYLHDAQFVYFCQSVCIPGYLKNRLKTSFAVYDCHSRPGIHKAFIHLWLLKWKGIIAILQGTFSRANNQRQQVRELQRKKVREKPTGGYCSTHCIKDSPMPMAVSTTSYFAWIRLSRPWKRHSILFIIRRLFPLVSESHRQYVLKESLIKPAPKGRSSKTEAHTFFEWLFWQRNLHSVINCLSAPLPLFFFILAPPPHHRLLHDSSKSMN